MDLFFNIDWLQLKSLINDLEMVAYNSEFKGKDKLELTKLLYLIESDLIEIKTKLSLPMLNPAIRSESVKDSFSRVNIYAELFGKEKIKFYEYFRSNDYQYWLLIYLLLKNNYICQNNLSLFEIIDNFIERIKEKSFSFEDIELTGSGATRCKTNLRFAFNDLKDLGLVYLYDKEHRNSWTPTFVGFFVASSFCLKPVDSEHNPLGRKITKFDQNTFYNKMNTYILDRILELSDPYNFKSLVSTLKLDSLGLAELEKGPFIFRDYHESFLEIYGKEKNEEKRGRIFADFLKQLDERYCLENYMTELSLKFDAESFFNELIKSTKL